MCSECYQLTANFATGFYIGRRMHRPGLSELETLIKHVDSLPVEDVEGQAYLRCADRCTQRRKVHLCVNLWNIHEIEGDKKRVVKRKLSVVCGGDVSAFLSRGSWCSCLSSRW